ncbi:S8 family serine peptidase [Phormidium tenue]|uniref:Peptidase S8 and S53 subtilisin kexin sedolisin n=1 Tax=Phormidium tenue NIES-30 TaxID=549789 RepID=A0A1U7IZ86_9CYAN|nr:S8 family serine peptidase [Phormidium tenue]MBD2235013.1 S8 family serine peptidase [Phormidium tenue FACHB-1052]OKH44280.1 peptidase S8 and S53 subtilisin kexin sedolisin [Phormidium tenue NIES-30]
MSTKSKISPAFEPFLADSGEDDKRDAIVIYQAPPIEGLHLRGRLRELKRRLDGVKEQAAIKAFEQKMLAHYQEASRDLGYAAQPLKTSTIGSGTLPVMTVEVTRKTLEALAEQPDVVAVLPNQRIHLIQPRKVEYEALIQQEQKDGLTWGLKQLEIPTVWEATKGKDINVAVLDTGVYGAHPALNDRVKEFIVIDPLGRRIKANPTFDCGQHGTHVCGTIVGGQDSNGVSIGVAPQANLLVAGVLIGDTTLRTLMEGISWAIEQGVDIINMSLGMNYYEPLFAEVLNILLNQYGILPVVAIGNENHGNSSSPGNTHNAFSIGGIEKTASDGVDVAFFSSGASLVFPGKEPGALVTKPDVVAPGAQIYSCIPPTKRSNGTFEYNFMDGTSMATPHVAGVAALLMAAKPTAPVTDIIEVLKETASHPDGKDLRPCNRWGYGLIQPIEALKALA